MAASSGYHLYLSCVQQGLEVKVTVRVADGSDDAGSPGNAAVTPPGEWDGHVAALDLELSSGHLVVMQLAAGPALEWDVPGGPGRFSVEVSYRNRELAARRATELFARSGAEGWSLDRITDEAQLFSGTEEYRIDLRRS